MPPTEPTPETRPDSRIELLPDPGWKVVLYNDDVTPFDVVIEALTRAAGLSGEVAEAVALEAHETGSAVVRRGLQEAEAQVMCGRLRRYSRIEGICPGLHCEAQRDA